MKQKTIWVDRFGNEVANPEIAESRQRIVELSAELAEKKAELNRQQGLLDALAKKFPEEEELFRIGKFRLVCPKKTDSIDSRQ